MIERYTIYEKKTLAMSDDDGVKKEYIAVPSSHLTTGIFIPASHPEIDRSELAVIEAENPRQAVSLFRQKTEEGIF